MSFPDTLNCACPETSGPAEMPGECIIVF